MKPLKRRFTIVKIPKNTKTYKTTEHNPYIELFKQQKFKELLNAIELENAGNALLLLPNNEESIPSEQNQILRVDQNNNIAQDDSQIIQDNQTVEWVSNNPIDQQFQCLVHSSQLYNIVNNSINNDQSDVCVGLDTAFLNDLNSCQTPDAIEITPPILDQNKAPHVLNQNENEDLSRDNSAQVNNIEKISTSTKLSNENDVDITSVTNEECEITSITVFVKRKDEIDKIVLETMNDMMDRLEKEFENF